MPRHRGVLIEFIKKYQIRKVAEVGVDWGVTCKRVLESCYDVIQEYWVVDPWFDDNGKYQIVVKNLLKYQQAHTLRLESIEAATIFPNFYFDLVYIDADHSYNAVKQDINNWSRKVKQGGILAGHDYNMASVKRAVSECLDNIIEPPGLPGAAGSPKIWMRFM